MVCSVGSIGVAQSRRECGLLNVNAVHEADERQKHHGPTRLSQFAYITPIPPKTNSRPA